MTGSIKQRSEGSWSIVLYLGRDPVTGKKKQKWHTFRGNKKAAQAELTRLLNDINTGGYIEPKKTTVAEFLERWLKNYAEVNVSGKTLERYQSIVRLHLIPAFGMLPVQKLGPMQIQQHYADCLRPGARKDGREGALSKRTVMHHHRVLSEALGMALKWQLIVRNPADAVTPPAPDEKEVAILEEDRSILLFEAAKGTRLYIPVLLASCGGLRRGEILAAEWSAVDFEKGRLSVRRSLEETKASGVRFKEPKTKRGRRVVALPKFVLDALKEHRANQDGARTALGRDYKEHGLICCTDDGSIWKPSAFTSAYRDLLRRRGITAIGFHNLRHSHASGLLRSGVDLKVISSRLGHSRVAFTADTYIHLVPSQDEEAATRTEAAFEKARALPKDKKSA